MRAEPEIYCPKCRWEPPPDARWQCTCRHVWHAFETGGQCPKCGKAERERRSKRETHAKREEWRGMSHEEVAAVPLEPTAAPLGLGLLGVRVDSADRSGYLLIFEIISVHLLVVLIGAAYLARAKRRREPELYSP